MMASISVSGFPHQMWLHLYQREVIRCKLLTEVVSCGVGGDVTLRCSRDKRRKKLGVFLGKEYNRVCTVVGGPDAPC